MKDFMESIMEEAEKDEHKINLASLDLLLVELR